MHAVTDPPVHLLADGPASGLRWPDNRTKDSHGDEGCNGRIVTDMVSLFARLPVSDYDGSLEWYRRLLGADPSFYPNEREAVWQVGENCFVYFEVLPERAGGSLSMVMVDDLDARVAAISDRGIDALRMEKYDDGMHKIVFADPDGNEFSFGGKSNS